MPFLATSPPSVPVTQPVTQPTAPELAGLPFEATTADYLQGSLFFLLVALATTGVAYALGGFGRLPHRPAMREEGSGWALASALLAALVAMQLAFALLYGVGYLSGGGGGGGGDGAGGGLEDSAELPLKQQLISGVVIQAAAATAAIGTMILFRRRGSPARLRLGGRALADGVRLGPAWLLVVLPWMMFATLVVSAIRLSIGERPDETHQLLQKLQVADDPVLTALLLLTALVVAPVTEEVLFRGVVQGGLAAAFAKFAGGEGISSRWAAILLASAGFAVLHEPWSIPLIFLFALMLGWLYERTASLWVPIIVHFGFNALNTAMALARA